MCPLISPSRQRADPLVCITGRFQPMHLQHLELMMLARESGAHLIVAITNPDKLDRLQRPTSEHRHLDAANPYTYFDRQRMIRASLLDAGLAHNEFSIVPFPLNQPTVWQDYVPLTALQIVRVYSAWEREKVQLLQLAGYRVEQLMGDVGGRRSSTEIRDALASRTQWQHMVPSAMIPIIEGCAYTVRVEQATE